MSPKLAKFINKWGYITPDGPVQVLAIKISCIIICCEGREYCTSVMPKMSKVLTAIKKKEAWKNM